MQVKKQQSDPHMEQLTGSKFGKEYDKAAYCHRICLIYMQSAAAAKSLQSCPTLCNPIDGSPRGSPVPGILQARTLEWVAESIIQNAGLDEAQAGIKIAWRNIDNLRYPDDTTVMAESEEELKSLLMRVKEENEKAGLKLNIKKIKITISSPITS